MSTQRGSSQKTGPPKHQNKTPFRNDLHDSSRRMKSLNEMDVSGVCARCKAIIEWKIKYKKYKQLTQPKKCVKCGSKAVRNSYFTVCQPCASQQHICGKCGQKGDLVSRDHGDDDDDDDDDDDASCCCSNCD